MNEAQSTFNADEDNPWLLPPSIRIISVKSVLEEAWKATKIMDGFDMESDFKKNTYNKNRAILKELCEKLGVFESLDPPRTSNLKLTLMRIFAFLVLALIYGGIGFVVGGLIGLAIEGVGLCGAIVGVIIGIGKCVYDCFKQISV